MSKVVILSLKKLKIGTAMLTKVAQNFIMKSSAQIHKNQIISEFSASTSKSSNKDKTENYIL